MNIVAMPKEDFDKIMEMYDGYKLLGQTLKELLGKKKLPDGGNGFDYYDLDTALKLLSIKKDNWYKNYRPYKVIPYYTYNRQTWIKKSDIDKFMEERRISK